MTSAIDNNRRFEGIWTFDRQVSQQAANILLDTIVNYRPELKEKVQNSPSNLFTVRSINSRR